MATAEPVEIVTGRDGSGSDVFGFLVLRGYDIAADGTCLPGAAPQRRLVDEYWGDPERSSVRFEADRAAFKPMTDVLILGHAYPDVAGPATGCEVGIAVADLRKSIAVIGDRLAWEQDGNVVFSAAQPFTALPLVFERAYGGPAYPRNPVGRGFVLHAMPPEPVALPNFEDPADLLTPDRLIVPELRAWNSQPLPQGTGWFGKTWYPRMSYIGAMPGGVDASETMREEALGLVPAGHVALARQFKLPSWDARFNNGAAHGLAARHLRGGEPVQLLNLARAGPVAFRLPADPPTIVADIGAGESRPPVRLHTVVIEPDAARLTLVWGACVPYPGPAWLPHMRRLAGFVT